MTVGSTGGGSRRRTRSGHVSWSGTQLSYHSLSYVNREICSRLMERGGVSLEAVSTETPEPRLLADPRFARLATRIVPQPTPGSAVQVRHQWPPDLSAPDGGSLVLMQPWEYGGLPVSWVEAMNDHVDETWCYTTWLRDCYLDSGVREDRVVLLPLGVDTALFRPDGDRYRLATDRSFTFLFVGGTIKRKGIDTLLRAYTTAFTDDDDVCLVIKGSGSGSFYRGSSLHAELDRLRGENPRGPAIEYIDADLPHEDVAALYRSADALVHPYRGEGFGLPMAEAMASGLPVIVTGHGACLDYCDDTNAYLIPAELQPVRTPGLPPTSIGYWWAEPDADALARLMTGVVADPELAREKGRLGRDTIERRFSWDATADLAASRLHELADAGPRRQPEPRVWPAAVIDERPPRVDSGLPSCSLVIVTDDDARALRRCVVAVAEHTDDLDYEAIIVDRSTSAEVKELLAALGGDVVTTTVAPDTSLAAARNAGARLAAGQHLVFLTPSVTVTPGWLPPLVAVAGEPGVGAVGPRSLAGDGSVRAAGVMLFEERARGVWLDVRPRHEGMSPSDETGMARADVAALEADALVVRSDAFASAGGFDEDFDDAHDAIDLGLRLRARGWRSVCEPMSTVVAPRQVSPARPSARLARRWAPLVAPELVHRGDGDFGWVAPAASGRHDESRLHGVNLFGFFGGEFGLAEAGRLLAEVVGEVGEPYGMVPLSGTACREAHELELEGPRDLRFDVNLVCANADLTPKLLEEVPGMRRGRHTIGYWFWENERFPDRLHHAFHAVDEVWAGSSFIQRALQRVAPCPVYALPPAVRPPAPPRHGRTEVGLPEQFSFLFMFDFMSSFERKNPLAVVEAFVRAFRPGEGPALVLKALNGGSRPDERRALLAAAAGHPDVVLMEHYLSGSENAALIAHCDAYVSLHRAEGFGLTMAEAMAHTKPVIATAYSGNLDFMTADNSFLVPYEPTPVRESGMFGRGHWADPDLEVAAAAMRTVYHDRAEAARRAGQAAADIASHHSVARRAETVRALLANVPLRSGRRRSPLTPATAPAAHPLTPAAAVADARLALA